MSSEWPRFSVAQLQAKNELLVEDGNHGEYRPRPHEFSDSGVSFIRAADMADGQVLFSSAQCINEVARLRIRKGIGKPGDVLLSHKGTVGKVAFAPKNCPAFVCSPQTTFWRVMDERILDRNFLFAYLQSTEFKAQLASRKGETDMADYVSLTAQRQLLLPVPDILTQRKIGAVFSVFNDRITLLRESNTTLEAIAQALFKSWFVDFDPVHAKAAGLEPEGMDAATAALFPDSFEESEMGLVPNGWKVGKVEDLMELSYGKALKATDRVDGPVPVYGSGGITGCHNASLVNGPSVIVGRKGTVGSLYWEDRPFFPIDTVFYVMTDNPLTYCYYLLQTLGLKDMNTDGAVPGLNRNNAYRLPVVVATTSILKSFNEIVSSLRNKMFSNSQHTQTLTQLRDTLLPRLISGQLRLLDAEVMVEEVCA